jgi:hypothetical protein
MPNPVDDHALLPEPVSLPKDTSGGPKRLPAWLLHIRRGLVAFSIALCLATSLLSWEDVAAFRGAVENMDPLELTSLREDLPLQVLEVPGSAQNYSTTTFRAATSTLGQGVLGLGYGG